MLLFTKTLTSQNLPLTLNSLLLSAMAFYEHIFAFSLVLALSLSSTEPSSLPSFGLRCRFKFNPTIPPLIQPKFPNVGLPMFQTLPKPKMPATLPSTQIPSPPTRPVTTVTHTHTTVPHRCHHCQHTYLVYYLKDHSYQASIKFSFEPTLPRLPNTHHIPKTLSFQ